MKTVYQAADGTLFESKRACAAYETACADHWIDNELPADVAEFFNVLPSEEKDEWYNTPRGIARTLLRMYWQFLQEKKKSD
ncbi:MAG: hypothetical protein AMS22_06345 [Thiotrichales bacterium SG8_50]|nr:MAG: hypothetical protein AMS22_06345 [Thiotrichales bacterium SG8_50]